MGRLPDWSRLREGLLASSRSGPRIQTIHDSPESPGPVPATLSGVLGNVLVNGVSAVVDVLGQQLRLSEHIGEFWMKLTDRIARLERIVRVLANCQFCRGTGKTQMPQSHPLNPNMMVLTEVKCQACAGLGRVIGIKASW